LSSTGTGQSWTTVSKFGKIYGNIEDFSLTDFGNTSLMVTYNSGEFLEGCFDQLSIEIYKEDVTLGTGKIIWNDSDIDGNYFIYIYGTIPPHVTQLFSPSLIIAKPSPTASKVLVFVPQPIVSPK
jgi:hypothetical protein